MRIRKNSRRVLLDGATPSASFIICHLNRSPWDLQDDWDNHLPINGSLNESKPTSSIGSGDSMELLFEYVEKTTPPQSGREKAEEVIGGFGVVPPAGPPPRPAPLPPKKPALPASTAVKKRGRPRKPRTNINNNNNDDDNPYQFYYYSGFGPSWSKRRGGCGSNPLNCDDVDKDNGNGNDNGMETPGCSSTTRESIMSDDDNDDDEKISKPDKNSYNNNGVVIESFESVLDAEKELDYIGDEEEEEEELYGGKRVRKPIKARSLKSLM